MVDQRNRSGEWPVVPEDIIGWFEVAEGRVIPGSYGPNSQHRVPSDKGFIQLEEELQACLLEQLSDL